MATNRSIALNYLNRFKEDIEGCLYCLDEEETEIYAGVIEEIKAIETTIKIINELEVE